MDYNHVTLAGRIGGAPKTTPQVIDPKTGEIKKQSRTSFSLIVNKPWAKRGDKNDHDTFTCVIFGPGGEKVAQYLTVGKTVLVEGRLSKYDAGATTPDGKKQHGALINVGPYGVHFGPDSQKLRTPQQVAQNNTATDAVLNALCAKLGLNKEEILAAANASKAAQPASASQSTPAAGPEVDLPFGSGEGIEG